jgi:hypothetical protein
MRSRLSTIAIITSPTIDSLNNLFATTKIPPRIYTTVAKRKYPPIEKEKKMARINGT